MLFRDESPNSFAKKKNLTLRQNLDEDLHGADQDGSQRLNLAEILMKH